MIAQLSQSAPLGSPSHSSSGVSCEGSLATKSGSPWWPQTSTSSKSRPAARTKMRTLRLLTLGLRMLRVLAAIVPPYSGVGVAGRAVVRKGFAGASDEVLDRVRQMGL